ncbi:structural protein VP2 [Sulfolobus polyhedral virus 1]|uniref:Structural protein VP2 n=1 Tax=Sulfolobus polyhedral virus 1 TaxID=1982658 RepID=A0A1W6I176_SPV1|nr:transcriptional repressor [Sulfolobus polyhedral virus 1]ARM37817.1 structural protein VP2 [Sulfolobus polyhedral virus 1]
MSESDILEILTRTNPRDREVAVDIFGDGLPASTLAEMWDVSKRAVYLFKSGSEHPSDETLINMWETGTDQQRKEFLEYYKTVLQRVSKLVDNLLEYYSRGGGQTEQTEGFS